jgi:ribonuclease BN (tRNA processing enzyme)
VRLYVPATIVERLHQRLAEDPYKLAEGGVNFWDHFQLIPVESQFWHESLLFDVFPVAHHGYRSAFGIGLRGEFLYTGDTRPIPEVLQRFAAGGEWIFHDCAWHGNPSHTGSEDLERSYSESIRRRLVLYHYESRQAAAQLRGLGYRVAEAGIRFPLSGSRPPQLKRVV